MVDVYFNGNHRLTPDQLLARRTEVNFKTFYLKNAMIEFFFQFNVILLERNVWLSLACVTGFLMWNEVIAQFLRFCNCEYTGVFTFTKG